MKRKSRSPCRYGRKKSLRRAQMERALAGDVRMQIWLGKNYLDQKDDPNSTDHSQPLPWQEDE